jgi:TIR domain
LMNSTFISYGAPDEHFARKLYNSLKAHQVITFFFPVSAKAGERVSEEVYRQIQAHDRVLLICSRQSLRRAGVLNEMRETFAREFRDGGAAYLLPIMLDDYVLKGWRKVEPELAERVGGRVIADFRGTRKNERAYAASVSRVLDALRIRRPEWSSQDFVETRLTAFGSGFEVIRADATDVAVTTPRIVERFNVIGNVNGCHVSGMVDPFLDSFLLEAGKERLCYRVIPTVTTSAHAGLESTFPTEATPIVTAVLAPLIRVDDRALWPASSNSHHHSIEDQAAVYGRPRRPSDNLTGEQIHDHG